MPESASCRRFLPDAGYWQVRGWAWESDYQLQSSCSLPLLGLKLIGKAARRRPDEQVGGRASLQGLDEDFVFMAFDLKRGAAGCSHRDWLAEFKHGQVVKGGGNVDYIRRPWRSGFQLVCPRGHGARHQENHQKALHGRPSFLTTGTGFPVPSCVTCSVI